MQCRKLLFMPLLPTAPQTFSNNAFFWDKQITKCFFFLFIGLSSPKLILFCAILKPLMDFIAHTLCLTHTCAAALKCFFFIFFAKDEWCDGGRGRGGGAVRARWSDRNYSSDSLPAERLSITALLSARRSVLLLLLLAVAAPTAPLCCFASGGGGGGRRATHLSYLPPSLSEHRRLKLVLFEGV